MVHFKKNVNLLYKIGTVVRNSSGQERSDFAISHHSDREVY